MELLLLITSLVLTSAVALPQDNYAEIRGVAPISGTCWQRCGYEYGKCSSCGPDHACCMKGEYHDDCDDAKASAEFPVCLEIEERRMLHRLINDQFTQKSIIPSLNLWSPEIVWALAIYDDVAYAATSAYPVNIYEINMTSTEIKIHPSEHWDWIKCLDASKDLLVTESIDSTARIWHRGNVSMITELSVHKHPISVCRIKENIIVTGTTYSGTATVYDVQDISKPNKLWELKGHTDYVYSVDISDDFIATGSWDHDIKLWNLTDGELVRTLSGHTDCVRSVRFVDNEYLISTGQDKTVRVWTVGNSTAVKTLDITSEDGRVTVENGLVFISQSPNISVFVWDSKAGPDLIPDNPAKVIKTTHTDRIRHIAATDTKIVSAGSDGRVNIIDIYPSTAEVASDRNTLKDMLAKIRINDPTTDPVPTPAAFTSPTDYDYDLLF